MHSGGPFLLHTPFLDRWGFEPSIDCQLLPGRKPGVFTDVLTGEKSRCGFCGRAATSVLAFSLQSVALDQVFPRYTSSRLSFAYC